MQFQHKKNNQGIVCYGRFGKKTKQVMHIKYSLAQLTTSAFILAS